MIFNRLSILTIIILLFFTLGFRPSGGCSSYELFSTGVNYKIAWFNDRDSLIQTSKYEVQSVNVSPELLSAKTIFTILDKSGEELDSWILKYSCVGGSFKVDPKYFLADRLKSSDHNGLEFTGDAVEYPSGFTVGDTLPIAIMQMKQKVMGATAGVVNVVITGRKCDSLESISTRAGTWNCSRIRYTYQTSAVAMGKTTQRNYTCIEWFSPKVGVVKSEFYLEGHLDHRTELTELNLIK